MILGTTKTICYFHSAHNTRTSISFLFCFPGSSLSYKKNHCLSLFVSRGSCWGQDAGAAISMETLSFSKKVGFDTHFTAKKIISEQQLAAGITLVYYYGINFRVHAVHFVAYSHYMYLYLRVQGQHIAGPGAANYRLGCGRYSTIIIAPCHTIICMYMSGELVF